MFTGLVAALGALVHRQDTQGGARMCFSAPSSLTRLLGEGASVCCNGACLTALNVSFDPENPQADGSFEADVSPETLALTTFGPMRPGAKINLEPALAADGRFGGHIVTGHVDCTGALIGTEPAGAYRVFHFTLPESLAPLVARKGSVCVDGVSLTVNDVARDRFSVMLIPHTLTATTLGALLPGDSVNLEADLAARYLLRFREFTGTAAA